MLKILKKILIPLLIAAAPMAMLYPLWSNPLSASEDDVVYYYPLRKAAGQALSRGQWPISDALLAGGSPILADPQSAVFFPATWLFAVMSVKLAYSFSIFSAFAIAGLGAWVYLRRLGLLQPAAVLGAIAFMFCGFFIGHRVHLAMIQTAALLPWGLWAIELLRVRRSWFFSAIVPIFSLAIFAGHWPTLIHMLLIWSAYFLFRARPMLRALPIAALAGVLVVCITAPQWMQTIEMMRHVTRAKIGYATAGENSYFPTACVLWLMPMLMGSRTPGFYPQRWWGQWHLCEMLGYVGLVVLVLAAATAWKLFRRDKSEIQNPNSTIVRTWTWLGLGSAVFMLGYYLPTYRLVHMLPGLGVVRCPARMILAVDFALITLAAIGVHTILTGQGRADQLARSVRRLATRKLPIIMLATLAVIGAVAFATKSLWPGDYNYPWPFNGGPSDVLAAVNPLNPAVWVPLIMTAATAVVIWLWLIRPKRRWPVLVVLLLADLFMVARFVDIPPAGKSADPENSPSAAWLKANDPDLEKYRVWGMSDSYCHRPAELLLARTNSAHGIASISTYGPFLSPRLPHVLGFRIYGTNRDWRKLLRTNALLSLYDVKYFITETDSKFAREIETIVAQPPSAVADRVAQCQKPSAVEDNGANLLTDKWTFAHAARASEGVVSLSTPFMWRWSQVSQKVNVQPGVVYRISLEARAPAGGAGNFLQADLIRFMEGGMYYQPGDCELIVYPEQIGRDDWRHFEWVFCAPAKLAGQVSQVSSGLILNASAGLRFRVFTMSQRPIEVRNISLRSSSIDRPIVSAEAVSSGMVKPGMKIYRKVAELPAVLAGDSPISIYENLLVDTVTGRDDASADCEAVKWQPMFGQIGRPIVGIAASTKYSPGKLLLFATIPAMCVYVFGLVLAHKSSRTSKSDA